MSISSTFIIVVYEHYIIMLFSPDDPCFKHHLNFILYIYLHQIVSIVFRALYFDFIMSHIITYNPFFGRSEILIICSFWNRERTFSGYGAGVKRHQR